MLVPFAAFCASQPDAWIASATSSTVVIAWRPVTGATARRLYLANAPQGARIPFASPPASANSYTLTGLAPDAPVFIGIETQTTHGIVSTNLIARTTGGPRVKLDTPVREVRAYATDILMVVLSGGNGAAWQAGPWKIKRANGNSIAVLKVSRDSLPVGAPEYQVGYGKPYRDDVLDIDHRIYLWLAEPIGRAEILRVEGPHGIAFLLTFNDAYLETPAIHLNQVGYNPAASERFAYISGWTGDGGALPLAKFPTEAQIVDSDNPESPIRYTRPVTLRSAADAEAGGEVGQIELSGIPAAEGAHFRVRLPGVGVSWPTTISRASAVTEFYTLTRGLFLNRWGGNLDRRFTEWARPADRHQVFTGEQSKFDQLYPEVTPRVQEKRITAGYHDAGDFEQRPMSVAVPELLMRAFELHPQSFRDGELNIPESGNGIPDLLDEALWGIAVWEQLQEPDGGVRAGIQSTRHPWGFYLANADPLVYWTFARDPNITARAAGLFAQASRLVQPFNARRAVELKDHAVRAWSYAIRHEATPASRLYGAGELFRVTRESAYREAFEQAWKAMGPNGVFGSFAPYQLAQSDYVAGQRGVADFILGYVTGPSADRAIADVAVKWLANYADAAVKREETEHAYRNPRPANYPLDWGQGTTGMRFLDTVAARLQMGGLAPKQRQAYVNALSLAADYLLGCNPNGLVYVTGLGARSVEEPLHLDSLAFLKLGKLVIPGIPVFGPASTAPKAVYVLPTIAAFYPAFSQRPPALRYADVRTVPNFNEFSVWETQAPDAELFAILLGEGR